MSHKVEVRSDIHLEVGGDAIAAPFVFVGGEGLVGGFDLGEVLIGEGIVGGIVSPELVNALRGGCIETEDKCRYCERSMEEGTPTQDREFRFEPGF